MFIAAKYGDVEALKTLLLDTNENDGPMAKRVRLDDTPRDRALVVACKHGKHECVDVLIAHNVDTNQQDEVGWSSLMYACMNGHIKCVQSLLRANAEVNSVNKKLNSALLMAVENQRKEIVTLLLECKDIKVNQQNKDGYSALMLACLNDDKILAKRLLVANASVNLETVSKDTAFTLAVKLHRWRCTYLLSKLALTAGVDLDHQNNEGWNGLMYACNNKDATLVHELVNER